MEQKPLNLSRDDLSHIVTNCPALVEALEACQCTRDHRLVQLVHGRASACQCYPPAFCLLVCGSVTNQLDKDLKAMRSRPRKKAIINSLCNVRRERAVAH